MTLRRRAAHRARHAIRAGAGLVLLLGFVLAASVRAAGPQPQALPSDATGDAIARLARRVAEPGSQPLFRIERSKNRNVVQYDARVTTTGALLAEDPIDAYWVKVEKGGLRKELDWMQRRLAYGTTARYDRDDDVWWLRMAADIGREIAVRRVEGHYRAEIEIAGRAAALERVYVESIETGLLPQVVFVDLHGHDLASGEPLVERLRP